MKMEARRELAAAFREITFGLMGLFQLHDVEPDVAEDAGRMLARVYQARIHGSVRSPTSAVQHLVRQLEHDGAATKAA